MSFLRSLFMVSSEVIHEKDPPSKQTKTQKIYKNLNFGKTIL